MFSENTLKEFNEKVCSSDPVPGGGSVSAIAGSLAAALSQMVSNLTIGKKKYAEHEELMKEISEKAEKIKNKLLLLADEDSESFNVLMKSFKLPKTTEEEIKIRNSEIEKATFYAAEVPLKTAKTSFEILDLACSLVEYGNKNAVTDAAVSAMMSRTAVLGALYNVKINLSSLPDSERKNKIINEISELEKNTKEKENNILNKVLL